MANRITYDLDNLNGIGPMELKDALKKMQEKQEHHSSKEPLQITKCRLRFIQQLKDAIKPRSRVKKGYYDGYKDLVIKDITKKGWKALYQKYANNLSYLKQDNLSDERRKRIIEFNKWYEEHRPPRGKRGRPKETTKNSTIC